ncbi:MAG: FAD-dependent oxidoreductase [Cyanobacteria bacterium]|nr:FAD-dependent oxidoreductase [Cyanobacteriota bacterium]MDW8201055.1 FAD-dependent oxidoreductase [Cyanobacteriota bacterium SKYGB_h_bin112]
MAPAYSAPVRLDRTLECELLIAGGGLAGSAAAYEGLLAGRTVCMTEITDWVGGQISSQGTSALDERPTQRRRLFFARGYLSFRDRILAVYGGVDPGNCWVSSHCFLPRDGHAVLWEKLQEAEVKGGGTLIWLPNTVIKELEIAQVGGPPTAGGEQIQGVIAIQHRPQPNTPPLNTEPLSQTITDAYTYADSSRFQKTIIRLVPKPPTPDRVRSPDIPAWYVIDATETGELIALADVPYRLGIDARSPWEPSAASETPFPYCTQGFTYTFAMEAMADPQPQTMPDFYPQYAPYYSFEQSRFARVEDLFTYRRIYSPPGQQAPMGRFGVMDPAPGDISMQNWTWGNDYRPGTAKDNLILSRNQLQASGQLQPGRWLGGLRVETLRKGEEAAIGFYYWLVAGTTDSQLGEGVKKPDPRYRYLAGLESPMGTAHGLSKYPYMREVRRIIGRPAWGHPDGFTIHEVDITQNPFADTYYQQLPPSLYRSLGVALSGIETIPRIQSNQPLEPIRLRHRASIYPDSVGIGHYAIDFHPCMTEHPPEKPGNTERASVRRAEVGGKVAYPYQIPLRAMIPQRIDNLLVAGKAIATSTIAAASYRVHSFEWSSGAAAGVTADFALTEGIPPYQLVDDLPRPEPKLEELQKRLVQQGNPIAFPNTSIFNNDWSEWQ